MKIYKVTQEANDDYDTYDSFICAAESEEEARAMHPSGRVRYDYNLGYWVDRYGERSDSRSYLYDWTPDLGDIDVEYLGEGYPGIKKGIILASYNAG
jgi:hypothetical protein